MSHYDSFENEQLTSSSSSSRSNTVPLKWFALAAVGCIGTAALISYARFSSPGARADFQEGDHAQRDINPKFRDVQLKYVEEDIILEGPEEELESITEKYETTATHQFTETPAEVVEEEQPVQNNANIPSYLLGYGENFVYQAPQAPQVAFNGAYEASNYVTVGSGDSGEDETNNGGSGDGYSPVVVSQSTPSPTEAPKSSISCWTCDNASSWADCANRGYLARCEESATSCQLEIRRRDGQIEQINTGCKQLEACNNNKKQNSMDLENPQNNQCRPDEDEGPSVCRQCCHSNNCNYMLDFFDLDGWNQELH